jgi:hypothetical protein
MLAAETGTTLVQSSRVSSADTAASLSSSAGSLSRSSDKPPANLDQAVSDSAQRLLQKQIPVYSKGISVRKL